MQVEAEKYLLDIRAFVEDEDRERLIQEAFTRLDKERAEKARRLRQEKGLAASLGAGLLLQFAVRRAQNAGRTESGEDYGPAQIAAAGGCTESAGREQAPHAAPGGDLIWCTVSGLLEGLDAPLPFAYRYGEGGKPYFTNYPFYFNLSHSGDYVACALSGREVGIDIQEHRGASFERVAQRFFSPAEASALMRARDRESYFFQLWARKEAYGKLTGKGILDAAGKNLWSGEPEVELDGVGAVCFEEYDGLPGYSMAVCQQLSPAMLRAFRSAAVQRNCKKA